MNIVAVAVRHEFSGTCAVEEFARSTVWRAGHPTLVSAANINDVVNASRNTYFVVLVSVQVPVLVIRLV